MDAASSTLTSTGLPRVRRADAGSVRLGGRDVAGLMLAGDMYGAPYDLLATFLAVQPDRLRGIVARWRRAGYAETGRLGPGPAWCWLTRSGLAVTGQRYAPARPALARLAHIRAVLAVRLSLEDSAAFRDGQAWWRSERRIRAAAGGQVGGGHVPDAEVFWPDVAGSGYAGRVLGDRGRADAQAAGPHGRDHDRAARPHRRLPARRPTRPRAALRPGGLPGLPGRPQRRRPRRRRAARRSAARLVVRDLPGGAVL